MEFDRRRVAFRFAVALALVAALLYGVGWERVASNLRDADAAVFAVAVLTSLVGLFVSSEGVRVVLDLPPRTRGGSVARRAALAAMFVRGVVPAGNVGGGAFIAYTVSKTDEADVSECVAGVASWEFLNMVASATVAAVGVVGNVGNGRDVGAAPVALAAFTGMLGLVLVAGRAVASRRERVVDLVLWVSALTRRTVGRLYPGLDDRLDRESVREGLDGFFDSVGTLARDRRRLAATLLAAHVAGLFGALPLYFCLEAVGLASSLFVVMLTMPLAGFALAIPIPGGIGTMDAAIGGLLVFLTGHPLGVLASTLVLFRLATYGVHVLVGGLALWTLDETVR
ncbi:MAG: YbhN family protein [Halobacterium sp.]